MTPAALGRLCVETYAYDAYQALKGASRPRAAVC